MQFAIVILAALITAGCGLMAYIVLHMLHHGALHLTYTDDGDEDEDL